MKIYNNVNPFSKCNCDSTFDFRLTLVVIVALAVILTLATMTYRLKNKLKILTEKNKGRRVCINHSGRCVGNGDTRETLKESLLKSKFFREYEQGNLFTIVIRRKLARNYSSGILDKEKLISDMVEKAFAFLSNSRH